MTTHLPHGSYAAHPCWLCSPVQNSHTDSQCAFSPDYRQSWLHLQALIHVLLFCFCLFSQGQKTNKHTPFPLYAAIHGLHLHSKPRSQQLLAVQTANTGSSTVDGDTEQLFQASRPCTMDRMAANFEL